VSKGSGVSLSYSENKVPLRQGLLLAGTWFVVFAMVDFAARSVLRVWVDCYWQRHILRYGGELLRSVAVGLACLGAACIVASLSTPRRTRADGGLWSSGLLLVAAGDIGIIAAGVCQACMHISGLVGETGLSLHPRSLVLASGACALAGVALMAFSAYRADRSSGGY